MYNIINNWILINQKKIENWEVINADFLTWSKCWIMYAETSDDAVIVIN